MLHEMGENKLGGHFLLIVGGLSSVSPHTTSPFFAASCIIYQHHTITGRTWPSQD